MDIELEIEKEIVKFFGDLGVKYKPKEDLFESLIDYFNTKQKLVKAVPRKIFLSDRVMKTKPHLPHIYSKAFNAIRNKIMKGEDITEHLSKRVLDPYYHDNLLNDWLIYHLHISNTKKTLTQKGFDRSKYLLIVSFTKTESVFIDIQDHNEADVFSKREYLETMQRNWPLAMEPFRIKDAIDVSVHYTNEEIHSLRKHQINPSVLKINGHVYHSPGMGIVSSGHSAAAVHKADHVLNYIDKAKEALVGISTDNLILRALDDWPYFSVREIKD